ncbi:hypothetical protein GCM10010261_01510 [Streptomyces pilosus]|nr:hypothetical protein GCM10010261_01510 [Streptomyces pilosus]
MLDPDPAGEPAEAGERIGVQDEQRGDGHGLRLQVLRHGGSPTAAGGRPEAERRIRVISANQVTTWAALRRWGTRAVGPYQALIDASARSGTVPPGRASGPVPPDVPEEKQQEGWT